MLRTGPINSHCRLKLMYYFITKFTHEKSCSKDNANDKRIKSSNQKMFQVTCIKRLSRLKNFSTKNTCHKK